MGIDVQLRDEGGTVIASVTDDIGVLAKACPQSFTGTRLLQYVVPWADAIFNQSQAAYLAKDCRELTSNFDKTQLSGHLQKIEHLVQQLEDNSHLYLWFIGD